MSSIWIMESSKIPKISPRNINKRGLIPGPVGTLPLDHFIYIIIGSIVLLCCSIALWDILKAVKYPKLYLETMRSAEDSFVTAVPYKEIKPPTPDRVSEKAREEVGKLRDETKYQGDGSFEPSVGQNRNLPIPVAMDVANTGESNTGIDSNDIEAWGNLVREKKNLNVVIANLERVAQARRQTGNYGSTNSRLLVATRRRIEVQNLIDAICEKFRERRAEWSAKEWQVVELIMQNSPR